MREIKFRFWHEPIKKIISWEIVKKECDRFSLLTLPGWIPMQFTGLKDKNGKDIYEGDILREPPESEGDEKNFMAYEVFFHDGDMADQHIGFQMNRVHCFGALAGGTIFPRMLPKWTKKMEIIGNIFENPGLVSPEDSIEQARRDA